MLFSNFGKKNYFVEEDFIELKDSVKELIDVIERYKDMRKDSDEYIVELKKFLKKSKKELKKFFNTSGILYREMELKDKLPTMTEEEMLKLLATDGKLVKRPMIVTKDVVLNGFKEEEWKELLKK